MSSAPALKKMSVDEYLSFEETTLEKHEFYQGEVFAMAGASVNHNRIVRNTIAILDNFLREKHCEVFPSDLKIYIEEYGLFNYPDLSIVCGVIEKWNDRNDTITNPVVIIEVLSKDTEAYDRGNKFRFYRAIPTLKEYILISSTEMLVEKFSLQHNRLWSLLPNDKVSGELVIDAIGFSCPLKELYRDVAF